MADVERLELGKAVVARDTVTIGPAVERPVMENGEVAVRCRVDIELDHIRAEAKRFPHRRQRVLDVRMLRRMDARCRAGFAVDTVEVEGLGQAAMREQGRCTGARRGQMIGVVEVDERHQNDGGQSHVTN